MSLSRNNTVEPDAVTVYDNIMKNAFTPPAGIDTRKRPIRRLMNVDSNCRTHGALQIGSKLE